MMDLGLKGKTALVLGAGSGLGRAMAEALAAEGAQVAAAGRTLAKVEETMKRIEAASGHCYALEWDSSDPSLVDDRVGAVEQALGPIDVLINNTGGPAPGPILGQDRESWSDYFQSMFLAVVGITDRVLPGMRERRWGRILTSTSSGAVAPIPNLGVSNTLRSALHGWSKTLAREVAADGITCNVILPGRIATERITFLDKKKAEREQRSIEEVERDSLASIPVGRYGSPKEYGSVAAFLASEQASYVTGSVIRVDGGLIPSI
jgi:3-oxoacyl-[acyl-carrier protein] reductase